MRGVLSGVVNQVDKTQLLTIPGPKVSNEAQENEDNSETITQAWFWPRVGQSSKENDIVITEMGTTNFGI